MTRTQRPRRTVRFSIPQPVPGEVERTRLLGVLSSAGEWRVAALRGPAGWGKSTLAAQWLRHSGELGVWVTINSDDLDPQHLARSIAASAALAAEVETPVLDSAAPDTASVPLARRLADDLNAHPVNLTIVLDNAEYIDEDAAWFISTLVTHLEPGHRVILTSLETDQPLLSFPRLIASGAALLLDQEQLKFDERETEALTGKIEGSEGLAGYAAALNLAAQGGAGPEMLHSLVAVNLQRLEPALRQAVPGATVLDVWSEEMARQIHLNLPPGWIQTLRSSGLPLTPLGDQQYRPHDLLRTVLEEQLRLNPEAHRAAHQAAADHALKRGEQLGAVRHLCQAGNVARAIEVVTPLVEDYERRGAWSLIVRILGQFELTELTPALRAVLGNALVPNDLDRACALLAAERAAGNTHPALYYGQAVAAYNLGHLAEALEHIKTGLQGAPPLYHALLLTRRAIVKIALRQQQQATEYAREALDIATAQQLTVVAALARTAHAQALELSGRMEEAIPEFEQVIEELLRENSHERLLGALRVGHIYITLGRYDAALDLIQRAAQTDLGTLPNLRAAIETIHGRLLMTQGRFEEAWQHFETVDGLRRTQAVNVPLRVTALTCRMWCELRQDKPERARRTLITQEHLMQHSDATGDMLDELDVCRGMMAYAQGDDAAAQAAFQRAAARQPVPGCDVHVLTWLHLAALASKQQQPSWDAAQALHSALVVSSPERLRPYAPYFQAALRDFSQRRWFVEDFARYLPTPPRPVPTLRPHAAPALQLNVQGLGSLRLQINGHDLKLPYQQPSELIMYLLFNGPTTQNNLGGAFYPHKDPDRQRQSVQQGISTINRVAQQLLTQLAVVDAPPLLVSNGGQNKEWSVNDAYTVDFDAATLMAMDNLHGTEVAALYRGPLMPGSSLDWVSEERNVLRELAAHKVHANAEHIKVHDPERATTLCREAIRIDPGCGPAYETYRELCHTLGNEAGADAAERITELLDKGIQPDILPALP